MKKIIMGALFMAMTTGAFAEVVSVKVNGMVCSMCAQGIQKKFKSETSVKDLTVDLDQKLVTLNIVDGQSISDETITKRIQEAGYNVAGIERK